MCVAFGTQLEMRMLHIFICDLSGSITFFHIISKNGMIFEKVTEHKMCVLIFSTVLSETFLILRRNERDMINTVDWSSCKVPVMLVRFQWNTCISVYFIHRIGYCMSGFDFKQTTVKILVKFVAKIKENVRLLRIVNLNHTLRNISFKVIFRKKSITMGVI